MISGGLIVGIIISGIAKCFNLFWLVFVYIYIILIKEIIKGSELYFYVKYQS